LKVNLGKPDNSEFERQWKLISRGAVETLPAEEFEERLRKSVAENKPLRVKQGFDPTAPDIHLGHTIGIRKLRQFQELGHKIVLIVGDYTAMVGDPSERSATRPKLAYDQIMRNAETYQQQFFKILDKSATEVHFNGEWFARMTFAEIMELAAKFTVARLLEREDFTLRMKKGVPISIHELFYPLMQGYDSVAIKADVEIGATEQTFNLLAGRTIQAAYGVEPQVVLTLPVLVGLDGEKRMSKSIGNYIGIDESPRDIFGKTMSLPDNLIGDYFFLTTDVSPEKLEEVKQRLSQPDVNPMVIKKELAETLVDMYHPRGSGQVAREEFERVFSQKQLPDEMDQLSPSDLKEKGFDDISKIYLVHLIAKAGLAKSNGEARKLIEAGAVVLDGQRIDDTECEFDLLRMAQGKKEGVVLKVGKRRYLRLLVN
jgi:tyrosyl-tRNA synthetase